MSIQMGTGANNPNPINPTGPGFFDNLFDFKSEDYMGTCLLYTSDAADE